MQLLDIAPSTSLDNRVGSLSGRLTSLVAALSVFLLLLTIVLCLQWLSGTFSAEFSGYPDEASHYISGLLVHDYLVAGCPKRPMEFAQKFYLQYPYLAIGHWPPLFYAVEGAWMYICSTTRVSVLLLMALVTTTLAATTYSVLHREFGPRLALAAAVLLLLVPLVQKYASMVMLDTLLAVFALWATLAFGQYLETGRWRHAIQFAVFASAAILTKGNGFFLALVPPVAIVLTRRFSVLKRLSLWSTLVIVAALCSPWHLGTMHLMLPTFGDTFGLDFTIRALSFYTRLLYGSVGPAISILIAVGLFARIVLPILKDRIDGRWAALTALVLSAGIFYCVVPAGIEARYLITALPPLLILCVAGADYIAHGIAIRGMEQQRVRELVVMAGLAVFLVGTFSVPRKISYGFSRAADALETLPAFNNSLSLVSSQTFVGEGIFVSEVAMRGDRRLHAVLRASKVLADSDWNVTQYRARYAGPTELMQCLENTPVEFLVLDMSPGHNYEHHRQLLAMVREYPDRWKPVGIFGGTGTPGSDGIYVYRSARVRRDGTPAHDLLRNINTNLNGTLKRWPISIELACQADSAPVHAPR